MRVSNGVKRPKNKINAKDSIAGNLVTTTLKIFEVVKLLETIQIYCGFVRKLCLYKRNGRGYVIYSRRKDESAGSDQYHCCFAGKSVVVAESARKRIRNKPRKTQCKSRLRVRYPKGYHHNPDGTINVREFGDCIVEVVWLWQHNHGIDHEDYLRNGALSRRMRNLLNVAILNDDANRKQFVERQRTAIDKDEQSCDDDKLLSDFELVRYHYVYYLQKKILKELATRDNDTETSMIKWGNEIKRDGGYSDFKDETRFIVEDNVQEDFGTFRGDKIWSFVFMTKWQSVMLKNNGKTVYLNSSRSTCFGLHRNEKVFLFTIVVKNQVTGKGAPAAFMLTNSQKATIIGDFLRKVKDFCNFEPAQVVIDYDQEKINAIHTVWSSSIQIILCRWHIMKAFTNRAANMAMNGSTINGSTINGSRMPNQEKLREAWYCFSRILKCKSTIEGEKMMDEFFNSYAHHPDIIDYAQAQWFTKAEYIIPGSKLGIAETTSITEFLGSECLHRILNRICLNDCTQHRPDFLICKLVKRVEPDYRAAESFVLTRDFLRAKDQAELQHEAEANAKTVQEVKNMVSYLAYGKYQVQSFTCENVSYNVTLYPRYGNESTCNCISKVNFSSCKHVFLAERWSALDTADDYFLDNFLFRQALDHNYDPSLAPDMSFNSIQESPKPKTSAPDPLYSATDDITNELTEECWERLFRVQELNLVHEAEFHIDWGVTQINEPRTFPQLLDTEKPTRQEPRNIVTNSSETLNLCTNNLLESMPIFERCPGEEIGVMVPLASNFDKDVKGRLENSPNTQGI